MYYQSTGFVCCRDGRVYIADTGNNRIVVLNDAMQLEKVIDTFDNQGTADSFKTPSVSI